MPRAARLTASCAGRPQVPSRGRPPRGEHDLAHMSASSGLARADLVREQPGQICAYGPPPGQGLTPRTTRPSAPVDLAGNPKYYDSLVTKHLPEGVPRVPLLVLAGGSSTRMARTTQNKLKLPVRSEPLLAYLLAAAHGASVRNIYLATTQVTHHDVRETARIWRNEFETIECHLQPPLGTFRALTELWRTCGSPRTHFLSAGDLILESMHLQLLLQAWDSRPPSQLAVFAIARRLNAGHTGVAVEENMIVQIGKSLASSEHCWPGLRIQSDTYIRAGQHLSDAQRDTEVASAIAQRLPGSLGACIMEGIIDINTEADLPIAESLAPHLPWRFPAK